MNLTQAHRVTKKHACNDSRLYGSPLKRQQQSPTYWGGTSRRFEDHSTEYLGIHTCHGVVFHTGGEAPD